MLVLTIADFRGQGPSGWPSPLDHIWSFDHFRGRANREDQTAAQPHLYENTSLDWQGRESFAMESDLREVSTLKARKNDL
jgi:hypothetical protein